MLEHEDHRQLSFFPELDSQTSIPSLSTLPAFDQALGNLIKMSDLGAFIQLNIQGLEKVYSLNVADMGILPEFLNLPPNYTPITVHLFPPELRNTVKKLTYDIKAFFNKGNSFRTSFGYFLFRSHFTSWKKFIESQQKYILDAMTETLGRGKYGHHFLRHLQTGYDHFQSLSDIRAPWEFRDHLLLKDIEATRKNLMKNGTTLHTLKTTDIDYPFLALVLKTNHIPLVLHQFLNQVQIHFIFKSVHLEYLSNKEINTIDDIRQLTEGL